MATRTIKPKPAKAGRSKSVRTKSVRTKIVHSKTAYSKTARSNASPSNPPRVKTFAHPRKPPANGDFVALAKDALRRHDPDRISDALLQRVLAAAVKVYAAKSERRGSEVKPFPDNAVTTTESVVAACALIRAADLNLFDVAMWFNRPPAVS